MNFKKKSYLYDRVGTRYHILLIWILGFTRRLAIFLVSLTDCVSLTERGQQEFVPDKFLPNKDHAGAGASIHPKLFYHLFAKKITLSCEQGLLAALGRAASKRTKHSQCLDMNEIIFILDISFVQNTNHTSYSSDVLFFPLRGKMTFSLIYSTTFFSFLFCSLSYNSLLDIFLILLIFCILKHLCICDPKIFFGI